MGFYNEFIIGLGTTYNDLTGSLPITYLSLINVFIFAILIALYSVFTWKFYRFLSKKDLIELNLAKHNTSSHPGVKKFFAVIFYFIEYVIVLPFLIFFWFAVLALLILILSENQGINQVIVISAAMVAAIRILAYYTEDLSRDLAKIFPFTVLTIFLLNPEFFSLERILTNVTQVPQFLTNILYFLVLIIALELILRIIDVFMNLFRGDDKNDD
jgi:hypothetical protein